MGNRQSTVLALGVLTALVLSTGVSDAQTTAPGPYYAPPAWDQQLRCDSAVTCPRFVVLSDWYDRAGDFFILGVAVLDRETGLVWERSPRTTLLRWTDAHRTCNRIQTGNRKGWRLPTAQELASLIDPGVPSFQGPPMLPAGHPFIGIQTSEDYWSATTYSLAPDSVWSVAFINGNVTGVGKFLSNGAEANRLVWCVRGGHGTDVQ